MKIVAARTGKAKGKGGKKSPTNSAKKAKELARKKKEQEEEALKRKQRLKEQEEEELKRKQRLKEQEEEEESEDESESDDSDSDDGSDDDSDDDDASVEKKGGPLFSDENAKWLKPKNDTSKASKQKKMQLMSSDEEDDDDDDDDEGGTEDDSDEGSSEEEEEELLEIEKEARMVDAELRAEQKEAEEELKRTIAEETAIFHLPTAEEVEEEQDRVVPPSELRERIENILEALADFKVRREPGRARSEYIDQLVADISELFGYLPELIEYFISMMGPTEALEYVQSSEQPRPLVIRTNTLKVRRKDLAAALMKRGVQLDPLASWSKVGIRIVESSVPIGATPEYLSGQYMLQSAASMCPVLALDPQPQEKVLDMSAAPGGKTSYIAQLMRNTGAILANDLRPDRQKATVANMHRLGVKNVITAKHDGRKLGQKFPNTYDRILLDAPCSGLGVIARDPSVKVQRTIRDVQKNAHLQKELLLAAIDALNHKSKSSGGVMVYSTCSISVAENEEVVQYALSKRDIKVIDTGLSFGKPGFTRYQQKRFHPSVALTRRFYPHVHNMDGFYVCKIQKLSDRKPEDSVMEDDDEEEEAAGTTKNDGQSDETAVDSGSSDGVKNQKGRNAKDNRKKAGEKDNDDDDDDDDDEDSDKIQKGKRKLKSGRKRKKAELLAQRKQKQKKRAKNDPISMPPSKPEPTQKKRRMNAKVTKPRRRKVPPPTEE